MRDEDVQLHLGCGSDTRCGCEVHARVADRGGDTRQRARLVLDLDHDVVRNGSAPCTLVGDEDDGTLSDRRTVVPGRIASRLPSTRDYASPMAAGV
jgi:hypothetical protein